MLHSGVLAATASLGSGLVLIVAVAVAFGYARPGLTALRDALRGRRLRPWECLGGIGGALFVASQGVTIASLGVARFSLAVVTGQVASALLVDRAGLGPGGRQAVTGYRVAGAGLAVAAVAVAAADRLDRPGTLVPALLPLAAGAVISWQQAVNGRVREAAGAVTAVIGNFAVGTAVLVLAAAVALGLGGAPATPPASWWLYLGGPLGVCFVGLAAVLVRWTGVLLLGLGMVAGQVLGALLLDGLVPVAGTGIGAVTVAGCLLALVAVAGGGYTSARAR